jgi:molybdopterin-binding protein
LDSIQGELEELGLSRDVVEKLTSVLTNKSVEAMQLVLGEDSAAVKELKQSFLHYSL